VSKNRTRKYLAATPSLLALLALAPGVAFAQSKAASATAQLKPTVPHTLMDQAWGLPWGTVKLPAGWRFNGGVVHGSGSCYLAGDAPMWGGESEDGSHGIAVLPPLKTTFTSDRNYMRQLEAAHCPILRSSSAADFLTQYVLPHLHTGKVEIVSTGSEPQLAGLADQLRQQTAQMEQVSSNSPMRKHSTVDTARVLVRYTSNGRTLDEMAAAIVSCTDSRIMMPMTGLMEILDCSAPLALVGHKPDDGTPFNNAWVDAHSKDPAVYELVPSPAWQQRFNQQMQLMGQQLQQQAQQNMQNQQAQFNANQARHQAQQDMYAQHNAAEAARQDAVHNSNQAFAHHMGDTNIYTNPQTGQQYELSNQYNNTYVNQNGNVALQTNSASSPGVDWTLLVPKY
jgi:hypothetical protein